MSDIICVTARKLCSGDFLGQLEKIAEAAPKYIILREKDLNEDEYSALAKRAMEICSGSGTKLVLHYYWKIAAELGADSIHLPLHILRELTAEDKRSFHLIGASCHSVEDAVEAEKLGADYITAGHVFETDCKKGLPPRGLDFLHSVCESVKIPVYAIGGIAPETFGQVIEAGASGACVMSGFMKCIEPKTLLNEFNWK
ncbi:thiamine phosphate synthase [Ruminococcus flavefaciens]|uniref:thiamine phosphate synthase n=1 Tax=Ruminococcus flavefaciens TaxID=1265 RepID=UPI0026F160CE|nr:thiamine phosphate synthase [Ruminococcus flavefaciens]